MLIYLECQTDELANLWSRGGKEGVIAAVLGFIAVVLSFFVMGCYKRHRQNVMRENFNKKISNVPDVDLKTQYNIVKLLFIKSF